MLEAACDSSLLHDAIARAQNLKEITEEVAALIVCGQLIAGIRDALREEPAPDWDRARMLCFRARRTPTGSADASLSRAPKPVITDSVLALIGRADARLLLAEISLVESDVEVRQAARMLRDSVQSGAAVCHGGQVDVSTVVSFATFVLSFSTHCVHAHIE